jgi:hypothetical protein
LFFGDNFDFGHEGDNEKKVRGLWETANVIFGKVDFSLWSSSSRLNSFQLASPLGEHFCMTM